MADLDRIESNMYCLCEAANFVKAVSDCLLKFIQMERADDGSVVVPNVLVMGYEEEGMLGLLIENFMVACVNPPDSLVIIEQIKEAYQAALNAAGNLPLILGGIVVTEAGRNYILEVELFVLH